METDTMTCICGETLTGEKGKDQLWKQYQEHLSRDDHQIPPERWLEAYSINKRNEEKRLKQEKLAQAAERENR